MQYDTINTQKHKHKHKRIYAQWNGPSETKPNLENCKNCSSKCAYDCAQLSVHNTAQNSSDNFPSYLQTIIIAQMLSSGGEGGMMINRKGKVLVGYSAWPSVVMWMSSLASCLTAGVELLLQQCCTGSSERCCFPHLISTTLHCWKSMPCHPQLIELN